MWVLKDENILVSGLKPQRVYVHQYILLTYPCAALGDVILWVTFDSDVTKTVDSSHCCITKIKFYPSSALITCETWRNRWQPMERIKPVHFKLIYTLPFARSNHASTVINQYSVSASEEQLQSTRPQSVTNHWFCKLHVNIVVVKTMSLFMDYKSTPLVSWRIKKRRSRK